LSAFGLVIYSAPVTFFNRSEDHIGHYRRLRAAGKQLVSKMYDAAKGPRYSMIKAAKKLTLPVQERTLIFDGETDTNALADFYLHEMRFGGKRIVDVLADSGAELTPDERDLLTGHRNSRCSLFAIVSVDPDACQTRLRDLLEPGAPEVALTDISLSKSPGTEPGDMLFIRLVHCAGLTMGAGLFFAFRAVHRIHLLNAYQARMRTVAEKERSERTYVFFYQKNRQLGTPQAYAEVV
jgi:hypothetical protein